MYKTCEQCGITRSWVGGEKDPGCPCWAKVGEVKQITDEPPVQHFKKHRMREVKKDVEDV